MTDEALDLMDRVADQLQGSPGQHRARRDQRRDSQYDAWYGRHRSHHVHRWPEQRSHQWEPSTLDQLGRTLWVQDDLA